MEKTTSKNIWHELNPYQKRKYILWVTIFTLIFVFYIGSVIYIMTKEKNNAAEELQQILAEDEAAAEAAKSFTADAVHVKAGTYLETIKSISLKDCTFRIVFTVWFQWKDKEGAALDFTDADAFRIEDSNINKREVIKNYKKDGICFQEMRIDATISKSFETVRFPLGSQVLNFSIEPRYGIDEVVLDADVENSNVNQNLNISGYALLENYITSHTYMYPTNMGNPTYEKTQINSQIITCLSVNRNSLGLYMKCFIALIGTMTWIMITVYICANHRVNPLTTIPVALFGTISNIMVGSNLLPDVSSLGLVEYVNFYGIMILLGGAITIIHINRLRDVIPTTPEEKEFTGRYARFFGRTMFVLLLTLCIAGHILMPVSAYMWRN